MEYLRQLKGFLREQPALGDGSEEMSIREALLSLEKHVTHYCRKHQIKSPPPDSKVHEHWNTWILQPSAFKPYTSTCTYYCTVYMNWGGGVVVR